MNQLMTVATGYQHLVLLADGGVDNTQGFSSCEPALLMHRRGCSRCSPLGACRLPSTKIHRLRLVRGTATLRLRSWLAR